MTHLRDCKEQKGVSIGAVLFLLLHADFPSKGTTLRVWQGWGLRRSTTTQRCGSERPQSWVTPQPHQRRSEIDDPCV